MAMKTSVSQQKSYFYGVEDISISTENLLLWRWRQQYHDNSTITSMV